MAQGRQSITIDSDQFAAGMSTSDNLFDGGFSPNSDSINPLINPGVIYATPGAVSITNINILNTAGTVTSTATTLDGNVIGCTYDTLGVNTNQVVDKWFVTDNGGIYNIINSTVSKLGVSISSSYMFPGVTGIQVYGKDVNGNPIVYISTTNSVTGFYYKYSDQSSGTSTSLTPTGWTGTTPHPMCVYNKLLFIADANYLHTYDGSSLVSKVLTLQSDQVITAMDIDPRTGRLMLAISSRGYVGVNGDKTVAVNSPAFIGLYDGTNPTQLLRKIPVDNTVTSFYNCGGVTYVAYGNRLGYFDGSSIKFLRNLNFNGSIGITTTNIYKHKMTNIDNVLYFVSNGSYTNPWMTHQGNLIIGYGEIMPGSKSFFNFFNSATGQSIDFVSNIQNTTLLFSVNKGLYSVSPINKSSTLQTGDNSPLFVSKRIAFPRPSTVNLVRVFFEDSVAADGATIGTLSVIDDNLNAVASQDIVNPSTSSATRWFDIPVDALTTQVQIKYQWKETSTNHGIQKIMVFFTPYE